MSLINENPMFRWIAVSIAALTLFLTVATAGPAAAQASTGGTADVPNRAQQTNAPIDDRGKAKYLAKAMAKIVRDNADRINNARRAVVNRLPLSSATKKKLNRTITAAAILKFLGTVSGISDTIEGWLYRAIEWLAPWLPNWLSKRIAAGIAFIAF